MDSILSVKELSVSYQNKMVIKDLSLDIKKNAITAIIGPSGCGKSTLLHSLNGLIIENREAKIKGSAVFNDTIIDYSRLHKTSQLAALLKERMGIVFQQPIPFPLSIRSNMEFALKYHGIPKKKRQQIIIDCLKQVNLYDEVKDELQKNALKLSGGQQQRLCIARALTTEPEMILLDEPCSALDVKNMEIIEALLVELKKNYTIVLVTHNISQAKRIADDVIFILDGQIVEMGTSERIFNEPQNIDTMRYISGSFG